MNDQKVKVSWGYPVLPPAPPVEALEDRLRREAADAAWVARAKDVTGRAVAELIRERGRSEGP